METRPFGFGLRFAGPCFNGLRYKFAQLLCNIPDVANLAVEVTGE